MDNMPLMLAIKHTYKQWNDYMQRLALEAGIPGPYSMIVMYLAKNPGTSQKELADYCQKTYASISQTIKEMQSSDYVIKQTDVNDQRYAKLYLTEKGLACANQVRSKIHEADKVITSIITPNKEKELIEIMELLKNTIQKEL